MRARASERAREREPTTLCEEGWLHTYEEGWQVGERAEDWRAGGGR
jgi:hypothetical protein